MLKPRWSNNMIYRKLREFFKLGTEFTWDSNLINSNLWRIGILINSLLGSLALSRLSKGLVRLLIGWIFLLVLLFTWCFMFFAWRLSWVTRLCPLLFCLLSTPRVFLPLKLWQYCRPCHTSCIGGLLLSFWFDGKGVPLRMLPGRTFWYFSNSSLILWARCSNGVSSC